MPLTHSETQRSSLLVIAGPTATGKTRLALDLAKHAPIEIISADCWPRLRAAWDLRNRAATPPTLPLTSPREPQRLGHPPWLAPPH